MPKVPHLQEGQRPAPGMGPVLPRLQTHQQAAAAAHHAGAAVRGARPRARAGADGSTPFHEQRLPGLLHLSWSSCLGWHRHSLERYVGSHAKFAASFQSCWQAIGPVATLEGPILSTACQHHVRDNVRMHASPELAMPTDGDARQPHRKAVVTVAPHACFFVETHANPKP